MKTLKVILIIVLFLFSFSSLTYTAEAVPTTAGTGVIDSYVKVNSVTKKKNGKISIKYTMKQDFKTKNLSLNINYPVFSKVLILKKGNIR